ncbi:MAG: hypothetical protein ACI4NU_10950 [Christensenellales bacterium]
MKKYAISLLAAILLIFMVGCFNSNHKYVLLKETKFSKDGLITAYTEYEYDDIGNRIKETSYYGTYAAMSLFGEEKVISVGFEYEYDDKGNIISIYPFDSDGYCSWYDERKNEYDRYGNLIKCTLYSKGAAATYEEYEYDGENRIERRCYLNDGYMYLKEQYEYDKSGKILSEIHISYLDTTHTNFYKYEYKRGGREVKKTEYYDRKEAGYTEYEYDAKGNLIKETNYSEWDVLKGWIEYEYTDDWVSADKTKQENPMIDTPAADDQELPRQQFLIESGTSHIGLQSGYYDVAGTLYLEDYNGEMLPANEIYGMMYQVFEYEPESIVVKDAAGKEYTFEACYIAEYEQYYVFSERNDEWVQLSERFADGFSIVSGAHKETCSNTDLENENLQTYDPTGTWECIGLYDPYAWEKQVDYYQTIPEGYIEAVNDALELRIDSELLTQIINGEESVSFSWSQEGQMINVAVPAYSEYYGYYQVDDNTIHEFYGDSEIYIYVRK